MPIYEYKCPECNKKEERHSPVANRNDPLYCMDCSTEIEYVIMKLVVSKSQGKPVVKGYYSENLSM